MRAFEILLIMVEPNSVCNKGFIRRGTKKGLSYSRAANALFFGYCRSSIELEIMRFSFTFPCKSTGILVKSALLWYTYDKELGGAKMALVNKLGLTNSADLAREEERISKKKAVELFENGMLNSLPAGRFATLQKIHKYLFDDIFDFAGEIRTVNLAKGNFRFAPMMYLQAALENVEKMPQSNFDKIIEKYVEMNVAHPFREGNGRSTRIWLDHILKTEIGKVVDWSKVDKEDYLLAMERSPIKDVEIKVLLKAALTDEVDSREIYMKGIDHSYYYEGYTTFKAEDLK